MELQTENYKKDICFQIEDWEKKMVKRIGETRANLEERVEGLLKECNTNFLDSMEKFRMEINQSSKGDKLDDNKLETIQSLFRTCQTQSKMELLFDSNESDQFNVPQVTLKKQPVGKSNSPKSAGASQESKGKDGNGKASKRSEKNESSKVANKQEKVVQPKISKEPLPAQLPPSEVFGIEDRTDGKIQILLNKLRQLDPMNKTAMSGRCDQETTQMENFLQKAFGFKNIDGECIVDGVKSFEISRPPSSQDTEKTIYFPNDNPPSFAMTIEEILRWQESYNVYTPREKSDITPEFLEQALRGLSKAGDEAFRMKFVVRISTCPILMEFDAQIIPRQVKEDWPGRIKLVSVTGVDFACRKHDVGDVTKYIKNWEKIFQLNSKTKLPKAPGGRDFVLQSNPPETILDEDALLEDLMIMAKTRLKACNAEGVEIVVETGIGLGVFSGTLLMIDHTVRKLSAIAIRRILEENGPKFKNIKAIVFALPIFASKRDGDGMERSVYKAFLKEFSSPEYRGLIPVLIIDQDMHRLTVAAAKGGFRVSELNPADSHGVFGEYWQNRGPAVEEKLALTTLGLLVQHHLINRHVLDKSRYRTI